MLDATEWLKSEKRGNLVVSRQKCSIGILWNDETAKSEARIALTKNGKVQPLSE